MFSEVMMKSFCVALSFVTALTNPVHAEVAFPDSRKYVATDEFYLLESFGDWETLCQKADNGKDHCLANLNFKEPTKALALELEVIPSVYPLGDAKADVDIVPRAFVSVAPSSAAEHYGDYSAFIVSVDDQSFDGFWCNITDETCERGPALAHAETNQLLAGRRAELAIYQRLPSTDIAQPVASVELPLSGLRQAFDRAAAFNAESFGFEPEDMVETRTCGFRLADSDRRISYVYDEDLDSENSSVRESLLGPRSGDCPSYVALAYATPDATRAQRDLFCMSYDEESEQYLGFEEGKQDAYGTCEQPTRSFCERVNASKSTAISIASFGGGAVGSAVGSTSAAGVSVVAHSSGAYILTGSSGYIAGTLGTIGTSALAILTAPAVIVGATVSVVAVGGAVYVCSGS